MKMDRQQRGSSMMPCLRHFLVEGVCGKKTFANPSKEVKKKQIDTKSTEPVRFGESERERYVYREERTIGISAKARV